VFGPYRSDVETKALIPICNITNILKTKLKMPHAYKIIKG
jgi:hypothetical protein